MSSAVTAVGAFEQAAAPNTVSAAISATFIPPTCDDISLHPSKAPHDRDGQLCGGM
jgi:hypothetical protein